jgi:hypothetical protein
MSYFWGAIKTEETAKIAGAIFMGVFVSLFIGIPLLLANNYYELNIPIWTVIIFIIIFLIVTYITYKTVSNIKSKK